MDYMGWVLSIYDECEKRYKKKYENQNKTIGFFNQIKEFFKACIKKENRYITVLLGILLLGMFIVVILYYFGVISNMEYYFLIPIILFLLGIIPVLYKYELTLENYEEKINILIDILNEHKLNNLKIKKQLLKSTRGILYKILSIAIGSVGILGQSGIMKYVVDYMKDKMEMAISLFVILALFILPTLYIVYVVIINIPNNRILRKKKFHQLLKILFVYDIQENKNIEDDENMNKLKEIGIKIKENL